MTTNIKIEIVSTEFNVMNGSILYKGRKAGHVQMNFGDNPKRVGNLIRALRKAGVVVNIPR